MIDRHSPVITQAILIPLQTVRIPSGNMICKNAGISVAKGSILIIRAIILIFCNFFFSIVYLISFLPNFLTANKRANIKTTIAHGKNGNTENIVLVPSAVKSCNEQDTK